MKSVLFPYGKTKIKYDFPDEELIGVLESRIPECKDPEDETRIVCDALENPIGSKKLSELAIGINKVVIIASDHTRPVPSRILIPLMLSEIRKGNPDADITILVATGCHRQTTDEELIFKFGEEVFQNEKIVVHDCDDRDGLVSIGTLPSGCDCEINKLAVEADLLVSEGFIEPHFFAGFSGGRKSVLPGIAGRKTVLGNHCYEFIDSEYARTGILKGNPIHDDMVYAARKAGLAFILNVVIDKNKRVIHAVSGDPVKAHEKGCEFLSSLCRVSPVKSDIVITTNGGHPLDQNIYQSVKGMTAAEACVNDGGVIIMLSCAGDGHGGENFRDQLASERDLDKTLSAFRLRGREETVPDQWQSQVFIRVLKKARVIFISDADDALVGSLHMIPAHSIGEAIALAKKILNKDGITVTAIPDGISVIVDQNGD